MNMISMPADTFYTLLTITWLFGLPTVYAVHAFLGLFFAGFMSGVPNSMRWRAALESGLIYFGLSLVLFFLWIMHTKGYVSTEILQMVAGTFICVLFFVPVFIARMRLGYGVFACVFTALYVLTAHAAGLAAVVTGAQTMTESSNGNLPAEQTSLQLLMRVMGH